ncbi:MAG: TIGR03936 family radical SAM-associated protein [Anaerolineales bacterium]
MRIRVEFAKTEPMRYTSHLDLYRAWERLLRRAGFQLVFSQGYNPRPKLQLASPLPLGITSRAEIIDFWLSDCPDGVKSILEKLTKAQPPGVEVQQVEFVDPSSSTLQKKVTASEYLIDLLDEIPDLESRITSIMDADTVMRQKREKLYDLRPLIQEISIHPNQHQTSQQIFMLLNAQEGGTGRPDEVLLALKIQPEDTLIERTKIIFLE